MVRYCLVPAFLVLVGCAPPKEVSPDAKAGPSARPEAKKYVLASEPGGAKGVTEVRKSAKDGDEVVVFGRVGGHARPFTEGRAVFLIVDDALKTEEGCDTPWDFCHLAKSEVASARVSVKFAGDDGKTIPTGARELFGLSELRGVVVKGKVGRDDNGNVTILASAIYVRPEAK